MNLKLEVHKQIANLKKTSIKNGIRQNFSRIWTRIIWLNNLQQLKLNEIWKFFKYRIMFKQYFVISGVFTFARFFKFLNRIYRFLWFNFFIESWNFTNTIYIHKPIHENWPPLATQHMFTHLFKFIMTFSHKSGFITPITRITSFFWSQIN